MLIQIRVDENGFQISAPVADMTQILMTVGALEFAKSRILNMTSEPAQPGIVPAPAAALAALQEMKNGR